MYIPNRLIKAIDNGQAAVFIGSGLSARVFSQIGKKYPLWSELVKELNQWSLENDIIDETAYRMLNEIIEKDNLTMAAQILRQKASKTDFSSFLDMIFRNDNRFDYIHSQILDIPFSCMMTTNYDTIIESAYNKKFNRLIPVYTWDQVGIVNNYFNEGKDFLFKLHGSFERENTVILAENDYQLLYHNSAYLELLRKIFLSKSVLFVGFGYNDPAIKTLISNLAFDFSGNNCMHYLLIEQSRYNNLEIEFLKQNEKITIIEYENDDKTHSKIRDFFTDLKDALSTKKKIISISEMEIEIANTIAFYRLSLKEASAKHMLLDEMYLKCKSYEKTITYSSYNLILFRKLLAYNYMNSGKLINVSRSKELLEKAIKEFEIGNFCSPEQFSSYFQLKLLLALTNEFYYQHNIAYSEYEKIIKEIEKNFPFIDEEIKNTLYRLMYIINPEKYFEEKLKDYKGLNLAISYQNKRRILEKRINLGTATDKQVTDLSNQFEQIKLSIDKLYHVTHYRLLFQYHLKKKEYEIANVYYKLALQIANEYEFWGQIKRIEDIKQQT